MKSKFENLGIWGFENSHPAEKPVETDNNFRMLGHSEQIELAQFGRVLHDWRPKNKQKKNKQEDKR